MQMYYVNTIEFNGRKACINSYSPCYVDNNGPLAESMNDQREAYAKAYPKAVVKTEKLSVVETTKLVANKLIAYEIGQESKR